MRKSQGACRLVVLLLVCLGVVTSFSIPSRSVVVRSNSHLHRESRASSSSSSRLWEATDDDETKQIVDSSAEDTFDGQRFASYLAPYVLTVVASIVVTGLFVKFVMLDY